MHYYKLLQKAADLYTSQDRDLRRNLLHQKENNQIHAEDTVAVEEQLSQFASAASYQKDIWHEFVNSMDVETVQSKIQKYQNRVTDSPQLQKQIHILKTLENIKTNKLDVTDHLIRRGVFGLLEKSKPVNIFYFSDTIADGDVAEIKIRGHYRTLEHMFGTQINIETLGSGFGDSVQTGFQVSQFIGSQSELEADYHKLKNPTRLSIFVNNATRAKHHDKELAEGSKCLWARVHDPKTDTIHDIIGVDNDVFAPMYNHILNLYVIEGIPGSEKFGDLSRGDQFRSLKKFPFPQFLNAISGGGAPAGFEIREVQKSDVVPVLDIAPNEFIMSDCDHYLNGKCISSHKDGVLGLAQALDAKLDEDTLIAKFQNINGEEVHEPMEFVITEYLGKHTGKNCIWNGSSRTLDFVVVPEIGKSVGPDGVTADFMKSIPIGTRIIFEKK